MAPSQPNTRQYTTDSVIDFVINKGHGVKGLLDTGIETLPKQYIQPVEERTTSKFLVGESIPVIDVSHWVDPKVQPTIWDAAEKWCLFQIINHGVPLEVLDNVKEATYLFFDLPAEEKNKYSKENSVSHNVWYTMSFIPTVKKALEWKHYLSLFYVSKDEAAKLWPPSVK